MRLSLADRPDTPLFYFFTPDHTIFVEPNRLIQLLEGRVESDMGEDALLLSRLRELGEIAVDYNLANELKDRPPDAGLRRNPLSLKENLEFHLAALAEEGQVYIRKDDTKSFVQAIVIETYTEHGGGGRAFFDADGEAIFWIQDWIS